MVHSSEVAGQIAFSIQLEASALVSYSGVSFLILERTAKVGR